MLHPLPYVITFALITAHELVEEPRLFDETCEDGACDLSLRQLRGQKLIEQRDYEESFDDTSSLLEGTEASDYWHGSCQAYGCHHKYHRGWRCQCNPSCKFHGNCCHDYSSKCEIQSVEKTDREADDQDHVAYSVTGSCKQYGCQVSYNRYLECQCTHECKWYQNCCSDYDSQCHEKQAAEQSLPDGSAQGPSPAVPVGVQGAGKVANTEVLGHPIIQDYPEHDGFTLFLVEEFDEPIDLDNDPIWTWSDGGLAEGQTRFVKEQLKFEDGKMKIMVEKNPGVEVQPCSRAMSSELWTMPLISGELRTRHNWFRYGRYEARIKAPSIHEDNPWIDGNYISTMFLYRDANFHHWREIDFEITGDTPHSVTTNMLYADYTLDWSPKIQHSVHHAIRGNTRNDFHTYAFEWLPDRVTWYIDGKKIRELKQGRTPIPNMSGKIMMNLWIFGEHAYFGGRQMHNNQYPLHSEYDWIRFYKWKGDKEYPCDGLSTDCLKHEDTFLSGNNPCDGQNQTGYKQGKLVCQPLSVCK